MENVLKHVDRGIFQPVLTGFTYQSTVLTVGEISETFKLRIAVVLFTMRSINLN